MKEQSPASGQVRVESAFNLRPYWMPFTANRAFKQSPRLVESASGFYYTGIDGRRILDSCSGLWTSGLGHCHPKIVEAVQRQVAALDYANAFQVGHSGAFELAGRLVQLAPEGFDHCFFVNSGSEAVDTALKIAIAFHRARGETRRTRFVGRERAYHGVNFGGMSVGGIPANREMFSGSLLPNVSHLPHTHDPERNRYCRGQPERGAQLALALERIVAEHGGSSIAAVIVEPVAGSAGVLVPPVGYLERLRGICTRHGILLIFDEVITAFARVGAPFASSRFGVTPDVITVAKGLTNGVIPMGAVLVGADIYNQFMKGPEQTIELFHGYTYSGHPVAAAAGLATLDVYEGEGTFEQARQLEPLFEEAIHSLKGTSHVVDIRNFGLMGAIELEPRPDQPGARTLEAHIRCFEEGLMVRHGTDVLAFAPFFTSTEDVIAQTFDTVRKVLGHIT